MKNFSVILRRAIYDSRFGILGWGIGLGLLNLFEILLYPTISEMFADMGELLENPFYKAFVGTIAGDAAAFTTPEGFFAIYGLVFAPLYIAVYLIMLGLGMTAGEEDRGSIDILLSTPVQRWQLVIEKALAVVIIVMLILVLDFVGTEIGVLLVPEFELSAGRLVEASIAMTPVMLIMVSMALFLSTVLRSPMLSGSLVGVVIIVSYFVTNLSEVAPEALSTVKHFSLFTYFQAFKIMKEGVIWPDFLLLSAATLIFFGLALVMFQRRDLAV